MPKPEIYVSIDIEANGPIPGDYSMLSFGAAAFLPGEQKPAATFEINLEELPGASAHPDTMAWWSKQDPAVWEYIRKDAIEPGEAMQRFAEWVHNLPGKPVMVVYPSWDAMWMTWYFIHFTGKNPFGLQALDAKSYAFAVLGKTFKGTAKRAMPKRWFKGTPKHDHTGLTDAIGQGMMMQAMMADAKRTSS